MSKHITTTIHRGSKPPERPQERRKAAGVSWVSPWDRKVLLLLRGEDGPHPRTWCFPAGKIEQGETPAEAAVREFREESGCWNSPSWRQITPVWDKDGFCLYLYCGSKFGPIIDGESLDFVWADLDNPPQPLHPKVAEQLEVIRAWFALVPRKAFK